MKALAGTDAVEEYSPQTTPAQVRLAATKTTTRGRDRTGHDLGTRRSRGRWVERRAIGVVERRTGAVTRHGLRGGPGRMPRPDPPQYDGGHRCHDESEQRDGEPRIAQALQRGAEGRDDPPDDQLLVGERIRRRVGEVVGVALRGDDEADIGVGHLDHPVGDRERVRALHHHDVPADDGVGRDRPGDDE